jgi:hypothetical protein
MICLPLLIRASKPTIGLGEMTNTTKYFRIKLDKVIKVTKFDEENHDEFTIAEAFSEEVTLGEADFVAEEISEPKNEPLFTTISLADYD